MPLPYRDKTPVPYKISVGTMPVQLNKTGDWRYLTPVRREKTSPCTAACPLHGGVAEWVDMISEGNWAGAWQSLSRYNPFPAITGYVCYRFCEDKCIRGELDDALAVGNLEKELGAWRHRAFFAGILIPERNAKTARRVAIIGSGPAGLSCAYYLSLLGVEVTVFEKYKVPGGLLALGIPEYRLPRHILAQEMAFLKAHNIEIRCGTEVGRDISFTELQNKFDAVFVATGTHKERKLGIKGEELPGIFGALDYLAAVNLGEKVPDARSVLVIGGGNAAVDAACIARLRGATVALAYRRTREAMPAHSEEVRAAENAGVELLFQVQPEAVLGKERAEKMKLVRTEISRRGEEVRALPGSAFTLECDLVLVATGQDSDLSYIEAGFKQIDDAALAGLPGVFAGGDVSGGPGNVAAAIGAGREAARAMTSYLEIDSSGKSGEVFAPPYDANTPIAINHSFNPFLVGRQQRVAQPETEASRCLSCGRCNRCGICWLFCPDLAVSPDGDLEISLDYCKGCGICARECPGRVLEMEVAEHD